MLIPKVIRIPLAMSYKHFTFMVSLSLLDLQRAFVAEAEMVHNKQKLLRDRSHGM